MKKKPEPTRPEFYGVWHPALGWDKKKMAKLCSEGQPCESSDQPSGSAWCLRGGHGSLP